MLNANLDAYEAYKMWIDVNLVLTMFFLRYTDKTEIMNMISFLDPRTKRPPAITAEEREIIYDKLLDALVYIWNIPRRLRYTRLARHWDC